MLKIVLGILLCSHAAVSLAETVVLKGATAIDVGDFGDSVKDLHNAVVVIENGTISAIGTVETVRIAPDSKVIDLSGKFLLPGFCDSFVGVANQKIADALLYMGVTSALSGPFGEENGKPQYYNPAVGPLLFKSAMVTGYPATSKAPRRVDPEDRPLSERELTAEMDALGDSGIRVFHLAYSLNPDQTAFVLRHARRLRAATLGELATTPYPDALRDGINALIHSTRYSLAIAEPRLQAAVAKDPFGAPMRQFYEWLSHFDPGAKDLHEYGRLLSSSRVGLIPTLAMLTEEDTGDHLPANDPLRRMVAGANGLDTRQRPTTPELGANLLRIERVFAQAGVHYLVGGSTHWGQLPGRSVHTEMKMLERIGLTRRQALAAGTSNFASVFGFREVGELKPGTRGDVVVLDANPLIDISNTLKIYSVYVAGHAVDRDSLVKNSEAH